MFIAQIACSCANFCGKSSFSDADTLEQHATKTCERRQIYFVNSQLIYNSWDVLLYCGQLYQCVLSVKESSESYLQANAFSTASSRRSRLFIVIWNIDGIEVWRLQTCCFTASVAVSSPNFGWLIAHNHCLQCSKSLGRRWKRTACPFIVLLEQPVTMQTFSISKEIGYKRGVIH